MFKKLFSLIALASQYVVAQKIIINNNTIARGLAGIENNTFDIYDIDSSLDNTNIAAIGVTFKGSDNQSLGEAAFVITMNDTIYTQKYAYCTPENCKAIIDFEFPGLESGILRIPSNINGIVNIIAHKCPIELTPLYEPLDINHFKLLQVSSKYVGLMNKSLPADLDFSCVNQSLKDYSPEYYENVPYPVMPAEFITGGSVVIIHIASNIVAALPYMPQSLDKPIGQSYFTGRDIAYIFSLLSASAMSWYFRVYTAYGFAYGQRALVTLYTDTDPVPILPYREVWAWAPAFVVMTFSLSPLLLMHTWKKCLGTPLARLFRYDLIVQGLYDALMEGFSNFCTTSLLFNEEIIGEHAPTFSATAGIVFGVIGFIKILIDRGFLSMINAQCSTRTNQNFTVISHICLGIFNPAVWYTLATIIWDLKLPPNNIIELQLTGCVLAAFFGIAIESTSEQNKVFDIINDAINTFITSWAFFSETSRYLELQNKPINHMVDVINKNVVPLEMIALYAIAKTLQKLRYKNASEFTENIRFFEQHEQEMLTKIKNNEKNNETNEENLKQWKSNLWSTWHHFIMGGYYSKQLIHLCIRYRNYQPPRTIYRYLEDTERPATPTLQYIFTGMFIIFYVAMFGISISNLESAAHFNNSTYSNVKLNISNVEDLIHDYLSSLLFLSIGVLGLPGIIYLQAKTENALGINKQYLAGLSH